MILNNKYAFWLLLAVPAAIMTFDYLSGEIVAMDVLHPTGEWSARFMIIAMILSPLISVLGPKAWLVWSVRRRRALGVAAFGYAVLHLIFYVIDMANLDDILAEFWALGIWTGWAAMLLFLPLALTSNEASVRVLKAGWKRLQRLVYPVAILVLVHWIFIHNNLVPALVHFVPLAALVVARYFQSHKPKPKEHDHAFFIYSHSQCRRCGRAGIGTCIGNRCDRVQSRSAVRLEKPESVDRKTN